MKRKNDCLNRWKGVAAFGVVLIHCGFFLGTYGEIPSCLARFAVPLFFMISGYFSYGRNRETIKRRGRHILYLLLLGNGVYLLWELWKGAALSGIFSKGWFVDFLLWNRSPVEPHLWFLGALFYCYLFYGLLIHFKKAYFLIPVLLGMNLLLGEGREWLGFTVRVRCIRSFWLTGLPFFLWGHWFASSEKKNRKLSWAAIAGGMVLSVAEFRLAGYQELHLGNILMAGGMILLSITDPEWGSGRFLTRVGELDSGHIYLWHLLVRDSVKMVWKGTGLHKAAVGYQIVGVLCVMAGSWGLAEILNALKGGRREENRV